MIAERDQVDLRVLGEPGSYPSLEEKLVLELAIEVHRSRSMDAVISWPAQEEAQNYFNKEGFYKALDRMLKLRRRNDRKEGRR